MTGLLVKDFRLLLQRKRFFILLLIVAFAWGFGMEGGAELMMGYLVLIMALFCISSISYDEYDNCYAFLLTLPIDKKVYVREKYLFGFVLSVIGWLVGAVIYGGYMTMNGNGAGVLREMLLTVPYVAMGILILDLSIPFQLKYGMERGRMAMIVAVIAVVAALSLADMLAKNAGMDIEEMLRQGINGISPTLLAVAAVVLFAALTAVSMIASRRIMEKKDF